MSIKLGTKKDLRKICHLPTNVQNAIRDDVETLDCFYGEGRDVDSDMGGFVVVCGADEDVCIQNFEEDLSKAEFVEEIFPFIKALYISGTERNIIIYRRKKKMDKHKVNGILLGNSDLLKYPSEVMNLDKQLFNSVYKDIAEAFGVDIAIQFYQMYKGMQISFPTRLFNPDYVRTQIPIEYDGTNIKQLAKKYGYSEKTIRRMIKENL